jgi:hypothetical protein
MRVDAEVAATMIRESIVPCVSFVDLSVDEIVEAQRLARQLGVRGGSVYDYMHLVAARKAGAKSLYTINLGDFRHLHRPGDPENQTSIREQRALAQESAVCLYRHYHQNSTGSLVAKNTR